MVLGVGMALLIGSDPRERGLAQDGAALRAGEAQQLQEGFSVRAAAAGIMMGVSKSVTPSAAAGRAHES